MTHFFPVSNLCISCRINIFENRPPCSRRLLRMALDSYNSNLSPPLKELPASSISRSPSPNFLESMKDLVPAPLRKKTRSPLQISRPFTADGGNRLQPTLEVAELNASPPQRISDPRQTRSVSPMPQGPPPELSTQSPQPRWNYMPREFLTAEQVENLPPTSCRVYEPFRPAIKSRKAPSRKSSRDALRSPRALRSPIRPGSKPSSSRQPRKHIPSMIDYLTMEQLENEWRRQDRYKGTVDVPTKPATPRPSSPRWRFEEHLDPRSPLLIHPAFRHVEPPFHNSFSRSMA